MTKFETIFGVKQSKIKKTCILMPLLMSDVYKYFGIGKFSKGLVYSVANAEDFTLIRTGIGPALCGDAVLYLENTPCENMILFGSCGLVKKTPKLGIGSFVLPEKAYNLESFTELIKRKNLKLTQPQYPDKKLLEEFSKISMLPKVRCVTIGSLKIEEDLLGLFIKDGIDIVDMECSSFFSAAGYTHKKAIAVFYVTDILKEKPFYQKVSDKEKLELSYSIKSFSERLCSLLKKNFSD